MKSFLTKMAKHRKLMIFITVVLILGRVVFQYGMKEVLEVHLVYLVHDYMYNIINYLIILCAFLIYIRNKKMRRAYFGILIILAIVNTVAMYKNIANVEFQTKFKNGKNSFVVKEVKDDPEFISVYTPKYGVFMRLKEKMRVRDGYKPFSSGEYKVIWLNNEKALIKFVKGEDKEPKAKILNFKKVNGEYTNVLGSLQGTWRDKDNRKNSLNFDGGQITCKRGSKIYWYSPTMADEQGNYGTILYGGINKPSLYILKNEDNTITVGYVDMKNDKQCVYVK